MSKILTFLDLLFMIMMIYLNITLFAWLEAQSNNMFCLPFFQVFFIKAIFWHKRIKCSSLLVFLIF